MKNSSLRYVFVSIILTVLISTAAMCQVSAGASSTIEPRFLVDAPTAGMIPDRTFAFDMDYFQNGGLLVGFSAGLFNWVLLGISYGGTNLVGIDKPVWNKTVGFQFRGRLLEETLMIPALLVGYDSQGKEKYIDSLGRYAIKSLGFYAVASKNYKLYGFFSLHGGINYTLERGEESQHANLFAGAEKTIGSYVSLVGEYNAGFNDQHDNALGHGKGYMNFGLKTAMGSGFTLSLYLKDVTRNQQDISIGNRTMGLEYVRSF
jgi:hypothetical protein